MLKRLKNLFCKPKDISEPIHIIVKGFVDNPERVKVTSRKIDAWGNTTIYFEDTLTNDTFYITDNKDFCIPFIELTKDEKYYLHKKLYNLVNNVYKTAKDKENQVKQEKQDKLRKEKLRKWEEFDDKPLKEKTTTGGDFE